MVDKSLFLDRLNRSRPIPPRIANAIAEGLRVNRFEAQETFLSPGHYATALYFIQSGLIRGAIQNVTEKTTTWFKQDGDIVFPSGLFNQYPEEEYISTVSGVVLLALPFRHLQKVIATFPEVGELVTVLALESVRQAQYREGLLRIPSARERYLHAMEHEPFIFKRAPHHLIASYLNVTPETYSRINKGLAY